MVTKLLLILTELIGLLLHKIYKLVSPRETKWLSIGLA